MTGRPRLPDAIKAAKGTLKPSRTNHDQPKLETSVVPPPPARMSAADKAVWRELADAVDAMRVMTVADVKAFTLMVRAVSLAEQAYDDPEAKYADRVAASKAAASWMSQFGMTPSTRSKVSVASKPEKHDPLAEFLS